MQYQNTSVRYERDGDKVTPVRVTKQWVEYVASVKGRKPTLQNGDIKRKFIPTRVTIVNFRPTHGPEEYEAIKAAPLDRFGLMEQGLLRPASYESAPCLELDDPSTWIKAVVEKGPPWADDLEGDDE